LKRLSLLALGAVSLSAVSCTESKASPQPSLPPPVVYVAPVEERDVPIYSESVATLDGYDNAEIRARVHGYVKTQTYKEGARMKAGDVLFTIEPNAYAADVASARAALVRANVAVSHNRIQAERDRGLLASGMISQQDMDNASTALADAEGQVQAARAALDTAELNLSYTQVRSPIEGIAGLALVRVGNLVGQDGPTLLTTVSQLDPMRINFPLSEVEYVRHAERFRSMDKRTVAWAREQFAALDDGKLADGEDPGVELVLADSSAYPHRGIIVAADRRIDPSTGTLQVQALVPNPEGLLRPGQYARARVRDSDSGHGVVVPQRALIAVQGTFSVALVDEQGKAHLRKVELGAMADGVQVVKSGLVLGERIVIDGVQKVADGAPVNAQPAPKPKDGER
jgi:membrane fusion protein, multidrug efflux system